MSVYPMSVTKISLDHKGGTKSYHFVLVRNSEGKCLVVNRWGKTGSFGEMTVGTFDASHLADKAFNSKLREKLGRGYGEKSHETTGVENEDDLRKVIGRAMLPQIGANNLKHLDPDFAIGGLNDARPPRYDEDGARVDNDRRTQKEEFQRAADAARKKEQEEAAASMKSLPTFGMF